MIYLLYFMLPIQRGSDLQLYEGKKSHCTRKNAYYYILIRMSFHSQIQVFILPCLMVKFSPESQVSDVVKEDKLRIPNFVRTKDFNR